ncbi:MAG: hypothetical protein Kow0042_12700 [Calditrichia bacterium]
MKTLTFKAGFDRREFFQMMSAMGMAAAFTPHWVGTLWGQNSAPPEKPATNIQEALQHPRTDASLPGKFPGTVVAAYHSESVVNNRPDYARINRLLESCLLTLTGASSLKNAWREFVSPKDIIGLKVNPVAGKQLSTSPEIVQAVIGQLEAAGIPRKNIVIWDRREFQLHEAGFSAKNFPGIQIIGTEYQDENGSFYDAEGKLYGENRIDREWYYWADCEMEYDRDTLPYMINQGKYSYFSFIPTKKVSKIINIPILKNAGPTVTLCLKNLAYGSISNTARLHKTLWAETCAQVPCFPPLRDKVVLNIVDGIRGCYDGGPGAKPQFFTDYKTILVGTDPVAVDRIGYEIVLKKRLAEKVQKEESPRGQLFMNMAQEYGLGIAQLEKITHQKLNMG